jgi:Fur family ferric uptake transcriptional regulator
MDVHGEVEGRLARTGGRYTATRRRLVDILASAGMPLSIADIVRGRRDLPASSAYRNLAWLEEAGLIRRVASEDGFGRYELSEELTGHHHHLLCSSCGRVEDVDIPPDLERRLDRTLDGLARRARFATISHRLDLIGLCHDCSAR